MPPIPAGSRYVAILPPPGGDRGAPPPAAIADWGRAVAARLSATTRAAARDARQRDLAGR